MQRVSRLRETYICQCAEPATAQSQFSRSLPAPTGAACTEASLVTVVHPAPLRTFACGQTSCAMLGPSCSLKFHPGRLNTYDNTHYSSESPSITAVDPS